MNMRAIETTATVGVDGTLTLQVPLDVKPGEHQVVIVISEHLNAERQRPPLNFPVISVGPWPEDLSLRREDMYDDWGR